MLNHILEVKSVRTLINDSSFTVQVGEICGLLGPNGAGKTTLIRMLTGLIQPTKGKMFVCGNNIQTERTEALLEVGAIIEVPIFFPYMTGKENLRKMLIIDFPFHSYYNKDIMMPILLIQKGFGIFLPFGIKSKEL